MKFYIPYKLQVDVNLLSIIFLKRYVVVLELHVILSYKLLVTLQISHAFLLQ